jgi:hypothetical protein
MNAADSALDFQAADILFCKPGSDDRCHEKINEAAKNPAGYEVMLLFFFLLSLTALLR